MKTKPDPNSLLGHLIELRNRLLRCVAAVLLVFVAIAYFARDIYALLAEPLLAVLPEGTSMIATDVAAPFFAPFKLTFIVAICLAIPYILWQVWQFIAPALYSREKRLMAPLVFSSTLLFYAGIAFAYFIVFPLIFAFFTSVAPEGVTIATDISSYLDFVLKLFFAFGLSFEIPIAILLLVWSGSISREALAEKRPYIIVGAFILGMLLTPPDVLSQTLLAIPMWLLFEAGLWLSRFYQPSTDDQTQEQEP
ncbi:Sec-independent protein secretion pathway component TatC [Alishewanella agri BL06]|jgi:sec-independent protein translocase protein TatC|uniref:Sec-independent protein translocase protein TatC n=1 Tax=Alishewanella agri BL06 TaxID=1195246 RepID=I8U4R1_9ALTE|nr:MULTISPECIES: twin-arginine translocase subunit TatC [Alishewanella]EIW88291.1 Sec-independent protein secretion pathway component TatC [Alishewanella agri BL06]KRS20189.1 twin-arginine protein translocation system subunit TatC [Alishewanella sp. WH16-1]